MKDVLSAEVDRQGGDVLIRVNAKGMVLVPSIEDEELFFSKAIDLLIENPNASRIVFVQQREYEYPYEQVRLLLEVANVYKRLVRKSNEYSHQALSSFGASIDVNKAYAEIHDIIYNVLKKDPAGAFVLLKRAIRRERMLLDKLEDADERRAEYRYITLLENIAETLEKTSLISKIEPYLAGHVVGTREVYRRVFSPEIKPDFMFTKLMAGLPRRAEQLESYAVGRSEVIIFNLDDDVQYLYHVTPPEFLLNEEEYELLDRARTVLSEHKPDRSEFVNPERMREVFTNVGKDLLEELAGRSHLTLPEETLRELTSILVRYTVGFGLIEVLLADPRVQDVTVNSPLGNVPIYIVHEEYGECKTNVYPSVQDGDSWATNEADPVLDTEITIPGIANARVGVIAPPLNPTGLAFAFRRHRDKPWTLPLFINNKMLNPLAAGLLSFLIDGNRTMLIAGTRSAGKSSLLGAIMVEIMRKYRIITIEDTLELPVSRLRDLGYNIQAMKVAGALSRGESEVPADAGIRTTLRLGDSALIVGEVRSKEARALYEAMRVGALANIVAGTIHGDSPYGVFDRVVNDLGVPRTSFKATDIILVANPVRSADGLHRWRRVTQVTEVRKDWNDDPQHEHGFVDLMRYNAESDELEPTDALLNGDSEIVKAIAGSVREWAGNWEAVWENIQLRARCKERLVTLSRELKNPALLEAAFVVQANDAFHNINERVKDENGTLDPERIFIEWDEWLAREALKHGELSLVRSEDG